MKLVVIKESVYAASAIAFISLNEDEIIIGMKFYDNQFTETFDSEKDAITAYKSAVTQWKG